MFTKIILGALSSAYLFFNFYPSTLCAGYWPENDLDIPTSEVSAFSLNESTFNEVLDRIESVYGPEIGALGGRLQINRLWSNGLVNASAQRSGNRYIINMYGGMARYSNITEEAFALVACHEIGHHLGGAPKIDSWFNPWATNEGQSDYFAGLKCFRKIYTDAENIAWAETAQIHPIVAEKCDLSWGRDYEKAVCKRFAMAGRVITQLFKDLKFPDEDLGFETPDSSKVSTTFDDHPHPQCRLDTYFNSALCDRALNERTSDRDPEVGACTRRQGYSDGVRPLCWYKP
ncbi:MAG: hypothetical protein KDD61_16345 [Bdellovibrionales bacterium]|nr:hypothetical protein [Bdellovibrionales bacterium]